MVRDLISSLQVKRLQWSSTNVFAFQVMKSTKTTPTVVLFLIQNDWPSHTTLWRGRRMLRWHFQPHRPDTVNPEANTCHSPVFPLQTSDSVCVWAPLFPCVVTFRDNIHRWAEQCRAKPTSPRPRPLPSTHPNFFESVGNCRRDSGSQKQSH